MALAELASNRYETATRPNRSDSDAIEYGFMNAAREANDIVNLAYRAAKTQKPELELMRVAIQSRRPVTRSQTQISNNPRVSIWVTLAIDATMLLAVGFVVSAFFVFLLELSNGRPAYLLPSFSAFFVFSIISLVSFRLKKSMILLQSDKLPK